MKKILLLGITVLMAVNCYSQDTIVKRNGEQLRVIVTEITSTEIKFKKFDFQDGPTYILKKQETTIIKYAKGQIESLEKYIPPSESDSDIESEKNTSDVNVQQKNKIESFRGKYIYKGITYKLKAIQDVMMQTNDKEILMLCKTAKKDAALKYIGFLAIPAGVATFSLLLPEEFALAGICAVVSFGCIAASQIYKSEALKNNRKAIKLFNDRY